MTFCTFCAILFSMVKTVSATQARNNFAEILNRVQYVGDEFIIEKQGKPIARITKPKETREKPRKKKLDGGTAFLLALTKIKAKGLPKDLAKNHDKYAWE